MPGDHGDHGTSVSVSDEIDHKTKVGQNTGFFLRFFSPAHLDHCTVVDGTTVAPGEEVQENSYRDGFFRLLLLEISTADIFEVYTEKMNFPGGLVSENLQFY